MAGNYGNGGTFDYGNVLRNVNEMKNRNALTQNRLDPQSPENQLRAAQLRAADQQYADSQFQYGGYEEIPGSGGIMGQVGPRGQYRNTITPPAPTKQPTLIAEFTAAKEQMLIPPEMTMPEYIEMKKARGTSVEVNTGTEADPFVQKYGKSEAGMMRNPAFDENAPVSRQNSPYTFQPRGTKDPLETNTGRGQLFLDTADKMEQALDAYWSVLKRTGTKIRPGADQMELGSAYSALQLEYKELAALGVLAGPDMDLIESVLQDPTTLKGAALEKFGGLSGYKKQLDLVRGKLNASRASARKNLLGEKSNGLSEAETTELEILRKWAASQQAGQ